jgi:hypothetical protein
MVALSCSATPTRLSNPMPTEIRMERGPCFGICPAYHVTLRSDGTLTYDGSMYVKHLGTWKANFPLRSFRSLARTAEDVRFTTLKTDPTQAYDVQQTTVTVKLQTSQHSVHENGNGRDGLHALEQRIDSVIKSAHGWKRVRRPKGRWQIPDERDTAT